jgi:4-hydroxyphenylpyruvate dioxygenase
VRVAYEALAWGRYVNDYAHAWKLVAAVDHPSLGVCLDSFHILSRGDDPAGIRDIPGEKVFFVQLADAPAMHLDVLQWSRHYRCFPGQGDFDLTGFMAHVLSTGYDGPLSLEVFNDVFRQADADRTATDALRSLVALEESLATRLTPSTSELAARDRVALATIDPPAELPGTRSSRSRSTRWPSWPPSRCCAGWASCRPDGTAPSRSRCGATARRACC